MHNETRHEPTPWVIVLAGGEGTRLRGLTEALHGVALPKQYARLLERASLLQLTVARALAVTTPERVIVVCAARYAWIARVQLARYGPLRFLVEPRGGGTTLGILAPLAAVLAEDPRARVAVLPSDHHFDEPERFCEALRAALACDDLGTCALVTAPPDGPRSDYGWILPGRSLGAARPEGAAIRVRAVGGFEEKPGAARARALYAAGALWSTFVLVADAAPLWRACRELVPAYTWPLEPLRRTREWAVQAAWLARVHRQLPPSDFSRDVLARLGPAADLRAIVAPACGWSDWGTPERVFASLQGADLASLRARVRAGAPLGASS